MSTKQPKFYDGSSARGYNAFLTMSSGARGIGKSFDWLNWAANDFERNGNRFAWVRRTAVEIFGDDKKGTKGCIDGFGDNVTEVYPKKKFSTQGSTIILNGKPCGEFIALTSTMSQKGRMRAVDDLIPNLIFDEFIIDNASAHYLGGLSEPSTLANLYQSIARPDPIRDTGRNGRIVLLSNSITFANPYYLYFNIKPFRGRYYYDPVQDILVEIADNDVFAEKMRDTRFGRTFANTQYAAYAFDNERIEDNDDFIRAKKPNGSRYLFGVIYQGQKIGFWADMTEGIYWAGDEIHPQYPTYAVTREDMTYNVVLLKNTQRTMFAEFGFAFQNALLYYKNIIVKKLCYEIAAVTVKR